MFMLVRPGRILFFVATILLAGCGSGDGGIRNPMLAAKVNNSEISIHQVRYMLEQENELDERRGEQIDAAVLERLIDQELIVQRARQRHLERDPEVARELEASRREILVRAYLERVVKQTSPPSEEEVRAFYISNPALFEERRIYEMQEITVHLGSEPFEALQTVVAGSRSLEDVAGWLSGRGLAFQVTNAVRPAEELPIESLDGLAGMQAGQIALAPTRSGAQMIYLVSSRSEPLDLTVARPFIEEYLVNDRMAEAARAEVARLRGSARILYAGDFVQEEDGQRNESAAGEVIEESAAATFASSQPMAAGLERGAAGLR